MKIISRVGKTRLAGLWRSSKWMLAIIIPIIGAIQLAGLSTGQPVKAQPATEQKGNDIVQLVHIPVIASHGSAEGQYMTPEDYEKQKNSPSYYEYTYKDTDYAGTVMALTRDGRLFTWGSNIGGNVGMGVDCPTVNNDKTTTIIRRPPCYYSEPQDITKYFGGEKIAKITRSNYTSIAITESGKVYQWGWKYYQHQNSGHYQKTHNKPTINQDLAPHRITGLNGSRGDYHGSGGWLAFNRSSVYFKSDPSILSAYKDDHGMAGDTDSQTFPHLDSDITDVDYVRRPMGNYDGWNHRKSRIYLLTANHKLLQVEGDKITEITNDTIAKRGGFRQISQQYAIDMKGGLWFYGNSSDDGPIYDMSARSAKPMPAIDSFTGGGPVMRSGNKFYGLKHHVSWLCGDNVSCGFEPVDVTTLISKQQVSLFSGDIRLNDVFNHSDKIYDYSFVPQDRPNTICTALSGVAYENTIEQEGTVIHLPHQTTQPVDGTLPATCVSIPDHVQPATPTNPTPTPSTPSTPKLPGVPNTGSQPDPIVQLVHIPAVINGAINGRAENLTAKDTDYAGTVMALTQSGRVFAWGNNYAGSVGVGTAGFKVPYPESVKSRREGHPEYYDTPQEITKYFGNDKVVRIGRYGRTSVAVTQSGKLYQWGWSYNPPWDWYDRLENIAWTEPTPDPTPSFNKVTGIGGSYGDTYSGGGWLAHGDDTIFTKTSTSQLKDFGDKLKLSLNGATIRSVDYVDFNGRVAQVAQQRPQDLDQSFRTGVYILTSTNKLLRVKNDGTTTEVTNDKIKSRGGIRQIANQYAIDNQGGLWYYGVGMSKDQIYDMSLKTLGGITPLPRLRDIVGIDLIEDDHMLENDLQRPWSSSVLVRSIDGHIYDVSPVETKFSVEDGGYPERRFALTDVTKLLGHDKIKLFDGKIHSEGTKPVDNEAPGLYDYSYVPELKLDTVCTVISGVASANASQAQSLYGHGHPLNVSVTTTKLVNDVFAPTCVKLPPLLTPDPKPSPTPNPKPTKPTSGIKAPFDRPKAPGAPNTGSQPLFADGYQAPIFAQR